MAKSLELGIVFDPSSVLVGTLEIDIISDATDDFGMLISMLAVVALILH